MTKAVLEADGEGATRGVVAVVPPPASTVPASLHASLMARLDRLGPGKEVAQIGAAIGRTFSHALMTSVMDESDRQAEGLDRLIQAGLLFRQGVPPHATYLFKHALVQDAAYGMLLRESRRSLHVLIAETIESQFAEIAESQPELLARHYTEAGLIAKAAALWGKAGERSLARSALVEAAVQLTHALEQMETLPGTAALRREQIKLQIALPAHQWLCGARDQSCNRAGPLVPRGGGRGRRTSRRSVAAVFSPFRILGWQLRGIRRRPSARSCGEVYGACGGTRGNSPPHDGAWRHRYFPIVHRLHRRRPGSPRSGNGAIQSRRASSAGDAIWSEHRGVTLMPSVVGSLDSWLP